MRNRRDLLFAGLCQDWTRRGGSGRIALLREPWEGIPLANHKSALKRIRTSERRRVRNRIYISRARTEIKKARAQIGSGDLNAAREATLAAIRTLDMAAAKGILHRNNAARRKSRLMKRLNALEAAAK